MKKVLIVDDEKNIRTSIEKCLNSEGYSIELACDGQEALDCVKNNKYDLVLMDIQMPKMTGLQALELMRKEGITTKVIIMTAYGTINSAIDSIKFGAIDFISKPFSAKKIKGIVKNSIFD